MSQILNEVIAANEKYIDNLGKKSNFALSPARGFAILTCMDAGLDKCF
jgi:carbonic anhydrase